MITKFKWFRNCVHRTVAMNLKEWHNTSLISQRDIPTDHYNHATQTIILKLMALVLKALLIYNSFFPVYDYMHPHLPTFSITFIIVSNCS